MKKNKIISATVAAVLLIGSISAFAVQSDEKEKRAPKPNFELTQEQKDEFFNKCKENLAKKLEDGKITQAEYDEQLSKIESGDFPAPKGRGFGKGRRHGAHRNVQHETVSE